VRALRLEQAGNLLAAATAMTGRLFHPILLSALLAACARSLPQPTPEPTPPVSPQATPRPLPLAPTASPTPLPSPAAQAHLTGQFANAALAVFAQEDRAYLGLGTRLAVLDVSDPTRPELLGQTVPLPDFVQGIIVDQGYAYLAAGWGGLVVVDVGDPAQPIAVGQLRGDYSVVGLAIAEDIGYLAAGEAGLLIVDLSAPSAPALLGSFQLPGSVEAVAVDGSFAYLAAGEGGLWFVEVSNPRHPVGTPLPELLGEYAAQELLEFNLSSSLRVHDVALTDGLLCFAVGDDGTSVFPKGLRLLDVSDPLHPLPLGSLLAHERATHVVLTDSLALYADAAGYPSPGFSLQFIDLTDPTNPEWRGMYGSQREFFDLAVDGSRAYLANGTDGLRVIDLTSLADPTSIGAYEPAGGISGHSAQVLDRYAYLADGDSGLRIVDLTDLSRPVSLSLFDTPGYAVDVVMSGRTVFVADLEGGLLPLNVRNPFLPRELPAPATDQDFYEVDLAGDYLLAKNGFGELFALSLAQAQAGDLERVLGEDSAEGLHVSGSLGYGTTYPAGLRIFDLSDPRRPSVLSWLPQEQDVNAVVTAGSYAYLATEDFFTSLDQGSPVGSLRVVDVSDPLRPREVAWLALPGFASAAATRGTWVALGDRSGWVYLIDVSSPDSPVEMERYYTPVQEVRDLDFVGSSLLISGEAAVAVLRLGEAPPIQTLTAEQAVPLPTPVVLRYGSSLLEPPAAVPEGTPDGSPIGITHVRMMTAEIGWAQGGLNGDIYPRLLRTTDGGHTWEDVTPPEPQLPVQPAGFGFRSLDAFFWDSMRAWAIYDDTARLWRTSDGGATWQASQPLPLSGMEEGDESWDEYMHPMTLQFIDPSNGWMSVNETQLMMHGDLELLRTRDGGASWQHIYHGSIYGYRGMAFLNDRTGWIADGEVSFSVETLQQTGDGGRTWERVTELAGTPDDSVFALCEAFCPVRFLQVFPPDTALLAWIWPEAVGGPSSALYVSADGGTTWQERGLPGIPDSLTFIDAQHGWLLSKPGGKLFVTEDGGVSWTEIRQVRWEGRLGFLTDQLGWAIAWPDGEDPWYQDLEGRALLRTLDGGRSWEQLEPRLVP
jgi:photosystem II stability/assembly factor-like uncharacterized protein